ncbi:MAG TPA: hypothetical protein VMW03_03045 [Candidatus Krumholzibacteriaceae bacterium]|nr:hypothetical protein [Candidatus Krumholzibacteriaceae bacterium]
MALVSGRKANSSIGGAIVLMLCIVVFAGTLFYLMTSPGVSLAFDTDNPNNPFKASEGQSLIMSGQPQWVKGPWSLDQAVRDLDANGCVIVEKEDEDGLEDANILTYDRFRTLAMQRRVVYLIVDEDTEALLVHLEDKYYVWTPQES